MKSELLKTDEQEEQSRRILVIRIGV